MKINIGTNKGNIVAYEMGDKEIEDISLDEIKDIVHRIKGINTSIYGWAPYSMIDKINDKDEDQDNDY